MPPISKFFIACVMSLTVGGELEALATAVLPTLPQQQVDITMPTITGSTFNATSCGAIKTALDSAAVANVTLTHVVNITAGLSCAPMFLPAHSGPGWIIVRTANFASLPAAGTRVTLADAANMPTFTYAPITNPYTSCAEESAVIASTGANYYRLIGIQALANVTCPGCSTANTNWNLFNAGLGTCNYTNTGHLIYDRVIARDPNTTHSTHVGLLINGDNGSVAVVGSYIDGMKAAARDADTQCILVTANPGPILVRNNFLRCAGENLMTGGGGTVDVAHLPKDITIQRNTFTKDPAWPRLGPQLIKTLLELKASNRVLIEGNDFLNMPWDDGGNVFRLTVRNQNSTVVGASNDVSDITIRYNLAANVTNFINSFGSDDEAAAHTKHSKRWYIHDNLIYGLGWVCGGGASCGRFYQIQNGGSICTDSTPTCKNEDLTITHNTVDDVGEGMFTLADGGVGAVGFDFKDNLINVNGGRGLFRESNWGTNALNSNWASTWTWTNNRLANIGGGEDTSLYPQSTNSYPANISSVLFTNRPLRDYTLQAGSPAKNAASDGTDQGVNFTAYNAARGGNGGDLTPPGIPQNVSIR